MKSPLRKLLHPSLIAILVVASPMGRAPAQAPALAPAEEIVTIKFPGGKLSMFIDLLRGSRQDLNVILSKGTPDILLQAVSLKQVTLAGALEILPLIVAEKNAALSVRNLGMDGQPQPKGGSAIYLVSRLGKEESGEPRQLQPIALRSRLRDAGIPVDGPGGDAEKQAFEDVLQAIESAIELQRSDGDDAEPPQIKLHPATGLLLVKGTQEQISLVEKILQQLYPEKWNSKGPPRGDILAKLKLAEEEVLRLRAEVVELKAQLAKLAKLTK